MAGNPPNDGGSDSATQRQYFYANLLVQHVWLQHTTGIATHDEMVNNLKYLFTSPMIRAFWGDTANSRRNIYVEGTAEQSLDTVATEIWNEYEAVLACSPENSSRRRERRTGERPS